MLNEAAACRRAAVPGMWPRNEASPDAKGGAAAQRSIEGTELLLTLAMELRAPERLVVDGRWEEQQTTDYRPLIRDFRTFRLPDFRTANAYLCASGPDGRIFLRRNQRYERL